MTKRVDLHPEDRWHLEFYEHFIEIAQIWNCGSEGRTMYELLCDQRLLDEKIEEALITHLPPDRAAGEFISYLFR